MRKDNWVEKYFPKIGSCFMLLTSLPGLSSAASHGLTQGGKLKLLWAAANLIVNTTCDTLNIVLQHPGTRVLVLES